MEKTPKATDSNKKKSSNKKRIWFELINEIITVVFKCRPLIELLLKFVMLQVKSINYIQWGIFRYAIYAISNNSLKVLSHNMWMCLLCTLFQMRFQSWCLPYIFNHVYYLLLSIVIVRKND
jgi:hypothetical protein